LPVVVCGQLDSAAERKRGTRRKKHPSFFAGNSIAAPSRSDGTSGNKNEKGQP
jgi:hypothetical protein